MRIVFLGTGEIALPTFRWLLESSHEVLALVTQPDKPVGRKAVMTPPKIKEVAEEAGVKVLQPEKVQSGAVLDELRAIGAELMVVMAYGQILPQALIEMPSRAIINLHASLLPKYRGASCIQAAIRNGDEKTGWTVMHVVKALDAGDVILTVETAIEVEDTGESLHDRLAEMGPEAMERVLVEFESGGGVGVPQDESLMTYAPKLERGDGKLDWGESAEGLARQIRAYHTWPGSYGVYRDGKGREKRLKVFPPAEVVAARGEVGVIRDGVVQCGQAGLRLFEVQPEGARRMTIDEFLRGLPIERIS
ncbi:MAG: methionyl-tRNA formyltransferase [Verrucomicrobiota bacterium]